MPNNRIATNISHCQYCPVCCDHTPLSIWVNHVISSVRKRLPLFPLFRTCRCIALTDASGDVWTAPSGAVGRLTNSGELPVGSERPLHLVFKIFVLNSDAGTFPPAGSCLSRQ